MRTPSLLDTFFRQQATATDLLRVAAALHDETASPRDRSHGPVTKAAAWYRTERGYRPERGGIFCALAFGPMERFACSCGALIGAAHSGEVCARCGVLCGEPGLRDWRFGHLDVGGVMHPALFAAAGSALAKSSEEIAVLARCDDERDDYEPPFGAAAVAEALRARGADDDLIRACCIDVVPVPPPGDRPLVTLDPATCPTAVTPWLGAVNEAWIQLVSAAGHRARLEELGAPGIIMHTQQRALQRAFERVLAASSAERDLPRRWSEDHDDDAPFPAQRRLRGLPARMPEEPSSDPVALLFTDDAHLLVQSAASACVVSLDGKVTTPLPTLGRKAYSVHGRNVCCFDWIGSPFDWDDGPNDAWWEKEEDGSGSPGLDFTMLDASTGALLAHATTDAPRYFVVNDEPEDLFVVDEWTGDRLPLRFGGDRPSCLAVTRDARFAWVGESEDTAVVDIATGIPHAAPPLPDEELSVVAIDAADRDEERWGAFALGLAANARFRFFDGSGAVGDHERWWLRIDADVTAAAFSPACERLAIATRSEVVVLDLTAAEKGDVRITSRFALPR